MNAKNPFGLVKRVFLYTLVVILSIGGHDVVCAQKPRILVFTKTNGWDHGTRVATDSIIRNLGALNGLLVDTTNEPGTFFTDTALARYGAICFINTTGTLFSDAQREVFKRYIRAGGGYVGMHASTDCEYGWSWYGQMAGANFNGHPFNVAAAKVAILDRKHPSTDFITSDTLSRTDEWYFWGQNPDFRNNPIVDPAGNDSIHVLMNLVESSIQGSTLNRFHPICWCSRFEGGRSWYCGFGHDPETFNDPLVKKMLMGGIRFAAGLVETEMLPMVEDHRNVVCFSSSYNCLIYNLLGRSFHVSRQYKNVNRIQKVICGNGTVPGAGYYIGEKFK
jgi:type 1 glutamine amidotransferase